MTETTQTSDTQNADPKGEATPAVTGEPHGEAKGETIPKARLDAEIAKRKEAEKAVTELAALKQAQADDEAKRKGDIEKFKGERDSYKSEAEQWRQYANAKLDALTEHLDDSAKSILADLEDAPLAKRLAVAEKLAGNKKPATGFGANGGTGVQNAGGVIPPDVTTRSEYHTWLANLGLKPEGKALLSDSKKMAAIREEAQRKFNI